MFAWFACFLLGAGRFFCVTFVKMYKIERLQLMALAINTILFDSTKGYHALFCSLDCGRIKERVCNCYVVLLFFRSLWITGAQIKRYTDGIFIRHEGKVELQLPFSMTNSCLDDWLRPYDLRINLYQIPPFICTPREWIALLQLQHVAFIASYRALHCHPIAGQELSLSVLLMNIDTRMPKNLWCCSNGKRKEVVPAETCKASIW